MAVMKHSNNQYSYIRGSDITRDGMYIEVSDKLNNANAIIEIFYSDVSHQMSVTLYKQDVPLEVVEWAIAIAHKHLPVQKNQAD